MINKDLAFIAVSGDGDTASIGIGQFIHAIRGISIWYTSLRTMGSMG